MKAFLLAAGLGTRLRPLTDTTPKCLLPVQGKPMLEIWLRHLKRCGVDEVLVNTHHLHSQVEQFAQQWREAPRLILSYEPTLLGSAGTLKANLSFVDREESCLVCYADNLTKFDVSLLSQTLERRRHENPWGVLGLFRCPDPTQCGIARVDSHGWIQQFEEKPPNPSSNLANSGLYAFTREALQQLPDMLPADIGRHFIPKLVPRLLGMEINAPLIDIGTLETYRQANKAQK